MPKQTDKMERVNTSESDRPINLHTSTCDKLYRWSMWRMYLNEQLSTAIASSIVYNDQSVTVESVTSPYIKHPAASKYGRHMKQSFAQDGKTSRRDRHADMLSDNMYLVFGIPRVFLTKDVPSTVRELHRSSSDFDASYDNYSKVDFFGKEHNVNIIRRVTSHDSITTQPEENQSEHASENNKIKTPMSESKGLCDNKVIDECKIKSDNHTDTTVTANEKHCFEERHNTIIMSECMEDDKRHVMPETQSAPLSFASALLKQQQKLLNRNSNQPRNEKATKWENVRQKRPEILLLSSPNDDQQAKKRSKPSQLWSFIFHRKKDILQMRRANHYDKVTSKQKTLVIDKPHVFEDNFQRELAERLKMIKQQTDHANNANN